MVDIQEMPDGIIIQEISDGIIQEMPDGIIQEMSDGTREIG